MSILVVKPPHRCMVMVLGYIARSAVVGLPSFCQAPFGWVGLAWGVGLGCQHLDRSSTCFLEL